MSRARILKTLELQTDSAPFMEALDALALIQREAPETFKRKDVRRHLRADLEDRSLNLALEFVSQAEQVEARLQAVQDSVAAILHECDRVTSDLESSEKATRLFVSESTTLRQQKRQAEERAEAVNNFLKRFQLTEDHVAALQGPVCGEFFDALDQVRRIRDECSELLKGSHQGAGLEIFDTMVGHQEAAHAKIYAWVLVECNSGALAASLDVESSRALVGRAFAELKLGSPAFYAHCSELLVAGRRDVVARKLSSSSAQHEHDAVRALSDVLATAHQLCAEERDILQSVVLAQPAEAGALLEQAVGGLPLQQKAGLVLRSMSDAVSVFKAEQVLDFYADTLQTQMGLGAEPDSLVRQILTLKEQARGAFFRLIERRASELQHTTRNKALPGADLSASMDVLELVRTMRDVLTIVRDHSLGARSPERLAQIESACRAFVEPVRALCVAGDAVLPSQWDACVFAVNNLASVQAVLALFDFTAVLVNELALECGERLDLLAAMRAEAIMVKCGMHALSAQLAKQLEVEPPRVRAAFEAFYRDLSSTLVMPELDAIDAPRLRHQVRSAACALVLMEHNKLYDVFSQREGFANVLLYSKEQVRDLLQA